MWTNREGAPQAGCLDAPARVPPPDEAPGAQPAGAAGERAGARRQALRVLIVDDLRDCADSLAMLVRAWGHDPSVSYGAVAALAVAQASRPDVVLMDIGLPKMDGFALARQLRQRAGDHRDVLFVAAMGFADADTQQRCLAEGFSYFLPKPFDLELLQDILAQHRGTRKTTD
jgi:CheY-like chemotaxis protein